MQHTPAYFDSLFDGNDDPWKFKSRWYEQRKRAVTLECLPERRYESAYEPGCANGELSAVLAQRCDRLMVSDGSAKAVALARQRLALLPHVDVRQSWVPAQWPDEAFDLVVISELGYFLSATDLSLLASKTRLSLRVGGSVLACHWRWKSDDCEFAGDEVNRRIGEGLALPKLLHLQDADFVIDVWCRDERSIGQRERVGGL